MRKKIIGVLILFSPVIAFAQEEAITSSGKTVILYPDSTWKVKVPVNDSDVSMEIDSVTTVPTVRKVETAKNFSETAEGFKGFLKPELKLPALPDQSAGVYLFKVKVNKDGYVKQVVTMERGPNGDAEGIMRGAITKLKFLPDRSLVPPLTEGTIRITVRSENR